MVERFGRFLLRERLGSGGMATVWRAHDPTSGREVALKLLHPDSARRRSERLLIEARAAAGIVHPHVVRVHEAGEHEGRAWLVMDLVEGETLRARLERAARLEPRAAAELVAAIADGLAAAHRVGVAHRDLKPENVLIDPAGRPLLTDFGLALAEQEGARLTRTGELLGTPQYMAPEQIAGQKALQGPPADVHALGVLLHELLTGLRPFQGETLAQLAVAIVETTPPPPGLDPALDALVLACLEKDPARRPEARAVAASLRDWLAGSGHTARSRLLLALLGLAVAGAAAALLLAFPSAPAPQRPAPEPLPAAQTLAPEAPAVPAAWPGWFAALPAEGRPPLPLPGKLVPAREPGRYAWPVPEGEEQLALVWIPPGPGPDGAAVAGFFLGVEELPWWLMRRFLDGHGMELPRADDPVEDRLAHSLRLDHPANPTWREARDVCGWLGLRLPTLAEWQRAARLDGQASVAAAMLDGAVPVAEGRPGPSGCRHLADNVKEWVFDRLSSHPSRLEGMSRLQTGPPRPEERLLCGGSFLLRPDHATLSALPETYHSLDGGVRPALSLHALPAFEWQVEVIDFAPVGGERPPHGGPLRSFAELRLGSPHRFEMRLPRLDDLAFGHGVSAADLAGPTQQKAKGLTGMGHDYFALRATTALELPPGRWRLAVTPDDGVRVWVNEQLKLDRWIWGAHPEQEIELPAPGRVALRLELIELEGEASLRARVEAAE